MASSFRTLVRYLMPVCILSSVTLMGCGSGRPGLQEAQGTVTLNGEPLADADIYLQPIKVSDPKYQRPSRGKTDAQGKFTVGTYGNTDGLPRGTYQLGVMKRDVVGDYPKNYNPEDPEATPVRYSWTVPKQYSSPLTSGLQVEVTAKGLEPATINIESTEKPEIEIIGGIQRGDGT